MSSLEVMSIQVLCKIFNFFVCVLLLSCMSLYIYIVLTHQIYGLQIFFHRKVFFPLCCCFLLLCRDCFMWCSPTCLFFYLISCALGVISKKIIAKYYAKEHYSFGFISGVSWFRVLSLYPFWVNFHEGCKLGVCFSLFLHVNIQFF